MGHCPSEDWDRYSEGMDAAAEAEMTFHRVHMDRILGVVAAIMINPNIDPAKVSPRQVVELAAGIVSHVVGMGSQG